jgi:WS/DGAT/MGAT family acyltransferase
MLDWLTPQDAVNLRTEARGSAMHVAGLFLLDAVPFADASGSVSLDDAGAFVERRLHLTPRLRQMLHDPGAPLGRPVWVDDQHFDVSRHLFVHRVAEPGDEPALLAAVQQLNEPRLDRSRPLWELWFLTGLAGGRSALLLRLHHVMADGVAALALIGPLFDGAPDAAAPARQPWVASPVPSPAELRSASVHQRLTPLADGASWLLHPERWWEQASATAGPMTQALRDGPAPRTFLNGRIGAGRRIGLARADLERARTVAHAHGAKINDVVLAAVAGGARDLFEQRGELPHGPVLRAMVPMSMRGSADGPAGGNRVAIVVVPLRVDEPDPVVRLEQIARESADRKRRPVQVWSRFPSVLAVGMHHQRFVNVFASNLPGPPGPWWFARTKVRELFQIGPVQGNVRLNVGAISYDGGLYLDAVADATSIPDLDVFAEGLRSTLDELGATP